MSLQQQIIVHQFLFSFNIKIAYRKKRLWLVVVCHNVHAFPPDVGGLFMYAINNISLKTHKNPTSLPFASFTFIVCARRKTDAKTENPFINPLCGPLNGFLYMEEFRVWARSWLWWWSLYWLPLWLLIRTTNNLLIIIWSLLSEALLGRHDTQNNWPLPAVVLVVPWAHQQTSSCHYITHHSYPCGISHSPRWISRLRLTCQSFPRIMAGNNNTSLIVMLRSAWLASRQQTTHRNRKSCKFWLYCVWRGKMWKVFAKESPIS